MQEHMALLGFKVKDVVSGLEGVVECISFDLYGCIQATVKPGVNKNGEPQDARWFDVKRLKALSTVPVMPVPDFNTLPPVKVKGSADKPAR